MEKKEIKEFIDGTGTMIGSKMKKVNPETSSSLTTDRAISQSSQGMVWMNYRRFYGESAEIMEYNDVADACAKDPKSFYDFLADRNETEKFEEYFTKDEAINEDDDKIYEIISDIVKNKKRPEIQDKSVRTIEEMSDEEPIIFSKIDKLFDFLASNTNNGEKRVLLDYLREKLYG